MNNTQSLTKLTLLKTMPNKDTHYGLFIQPEVPFWFVANEKATKLLTACDGILNKDESSLKRLIC